MASPDLNITEQPQNVVETHGCAASKSAECLWSLGDFMPQRTETKKGFNQDLTNEMAVECNSMYVFFFMIETF